MDFAADCDKITTTGQRKGVESMRHILIVMSLALLPSCAAGGLAEQERRSEVTEQARLDDALKGLTPGKPRSCIPLRDAQGTESFGKDKILFRAGRKLVYVTQTRGSCRDIGNGSALVTKVFGSELCRGDFAESFDTSARASFGYCVMGDFTPYRGS
jgi:hypothetical protein